MSEGCGNPPKDPYFTGWPSFMVDVNAVQNRSQGMLSWLYGVSGVLYYETTLHLDTAWSSVYDFGGNGDGTLLYPGKPSVIGGTTDVPVASIRLKMIRDGFEDYEYMKMVSDLGDPNFAQQTGQALFPDVFASNQTPAALSTAREQLAQRILQLKGQGGPTVSMTAPANGSTVSGTITLSATASDPHGVAGVTFLVDGTATGSEVTTSPYTMQYNTTVLANGSHTFAARARNTAGATTTSTAVTVTVSNSGGGTGALAVTTAMALSPASPVVNQSTTATFTVKNTGTAAMTIQYFLVGARDPSNANVDFPASPTVTLQPGQSYTYSGSRSFATTGTYSAWPAYFDGTNWIQLATPVNFTVGAAGPGKITLVTALALSPTSPVVNQSTTATFMVQNTGGSAISVPYFLVGARDPANGNVDFPASASVTLQPGQQYTYSGSRSFATTGTYTAWPAYFDGTNWIQLATPSSFTVQAPSLRSDTNYVDLDPEVKDPYGIPVARLHFQWDENALKMWEHSKQACAEVLRAAGGVLEGTGEAPEIPGYSLHETGTCRMGNDATKFVTNRFGQTHDVANLYVCDASVFLNCTDKTTTLSILAFALRSSDRLVEQFRGGSL